MGTRRKSRELVLQMLFQADMGKQTVDQVQHTFWAEHDTASAEVRGFAEDLFRVATDRGPDHEIGGKAEADDLRRNNSLLRRIDHTADSSH